LEYNLNFFNSWVGGFWEGDGAGKVGGGRIKAIKNLKSLLIIKHNKN